MKADELRPCDICRNGLCETSRVPLFWRVKIERMGVDIRAAQRHSGLEGFFGGGQAGAVMASVMGPGEDIAKSLADPVTLLVCEDCAIRRLEPIAGLAERVPAQDATA